MSRNNLNSNNFLLGVVKNSENNSSNKKTSDSLLNHLKVLENESNNVSNKKSSNYPSIETVVNELIQKLENDVFVLNNKIKSFNLEKKAIIDLDKKEINNLKNIIRKLYILILTINKTIKPNRNMSFNNKKSLIENIRKNLESSKGFLKIVDEIMKDNKEEVSEKVNEEDNILSKYISNNNVKISNIFVNHLKKNQEKKEVKEIVNISETNNRNNIFNNKNSNENLIRTLNNNNKNNKNESSLNTNNKNNKNESSLNNTRNSPEINISNNNSSGNKTLNINNSGISNIVFEKNNNKKNKKYDILKKKISNTEITKNEAKESLSKYFLQ